MFAKVCSVDLPLDPERPLVDKLRNLRGWTMNRTVFKRLLDPKDDEYAFMGNMWMTRCGCQVESISRQAQPQLPHHLIRTNRADMFVLGDCMWPAVEGGIQRLF